MDRYAKKNSGAVKVIVSTDYNLLENKPSLSQVVETFVPMNKQIEFALANKPNTARTIKLFINGLYEESFTVTDNKLFYTGTHFELSNTDILKIIYYTN